MYIHCCSVCNADNGMNNGGDGEGMTCIISHASLPIGAQRSPDTSSIVCRSRSLTLSKNICSSAARFCLLFHTPSNYFFWFVFLVCLYYIRGVQSTPFVQQLWMSILFCLYTTLEFILWNFDPRSQAVYVQSLKITGSTIRMSRSRK